MCEEEDKEKVPERPVQQPDDQIETNKEKIPARPSTKESREESEEN